MKFLIEGGRWLEVRGMMISKEILVDRTGKAIINISEWCEKNTVSMK